MSTATTIPRFTTRQAARYVERDYSWVRKVCTREGIGTLVGPRCRLLSDRDLHTLGAYFSTRERRK